MRFHKINNFVKRRFKHYEWDKKLDTTQQTIYLTFDDGPIPDITAFVLESLAKFEAKATFFCVGDNIRKHPDIFQKVLEGEHQVGNHTFNHIKGWFTKNEAYFENVDKCQKIILEKASENKKQGFFSSSRPLFRPPYGQIKSSQGKILKEKYRIVMWDTLSYDFDKTLEAEKCLAKTIKYTKAGSIVVFHDSIKAAKNMTYVLPRYLEYFSKRGFKFDTL